MKDILVIGFGASSLNLRALLSCSNNSKLNFYFLDSLDPQFVRSTLSNLDLKNSIIYIISKSGSTSETNILAKLIIGLGAQNIKILCGNKDSELAKIAMGVKHDWIDFIGENSGRFALLTKPFFDIVSLAGIDIELLKKGSASVDLKEVQEKAKNWVGHFEAGRKIWVIMLYSKQLFGLFMWIRQIVSESLGKNGFGILPFLCEGTMDEHSQLQLFLDGPRDKFYEIISCEYDDVFFHHHEEQQDGDVVNHTNYKTGLPRQSYAFPRNDVAKAQIKHAAKVASLMKNKNLLYEHIHHEKVDAYLVGKYIGTYLHLVKAIGAKLDFDPLTQPAVESMKRWSDEN